MAVFALSCNNAIQPTSNAVTNVKGKAMLLGKINVAALEKAPFSDWYQKEYAAYSPGASTSDSLKPLVRQYRFELFFGSWCGDSRRHVPRIMKLLHELGVKHSAITIIAVGNRDTLYKQSPTHEESGKFIYRVPTLNIYKNGKEAGRITETPVKSWEQDLLDILLGRAYTPKFPILK